MQYPDAAIACDCGAARASAHPRGFGTFPRVLGRYVREAHALSLAQRCEDDRLRRRSSAWWIAASSRSAWRRISRRSTPRR